MKAKYLHNSDFLNCVHRRTDSPSIINSIGLLKKDIIWKVGKENHISFCFNNWIKNISLIDILGIEETNVSNLDMKIGDFIT